MIIKIPSKTKYKKIFTPKLFNYKNWTFCKIYNNNFQFNHNYKYVNFYLNLNLSNHNSFKIKFFLKFQILKDLLILRRSNLDFLYNIYLFLSYDYFLYFFNTNLYLYNNLFSLMIYFILFLLLLLLFFESKITFVNWLTLLNFVIAL